MSNQANIDLLETIFEEVQEAFPYLDEEKQIEIANNRFEEMCQWLKYSLFLEVPTLFIL